MTIYPVTVVHTEIIFSRHYLAQDIVNMIKVIITGSRKLKTVHYTSPRVQIFNQLEIRKLIR